MSYTAIRIENIGKQYRIGSERHAYKTVRESLTDIGKAPARILRQMLSKNGSRQGNYENFWALKNISLEVEKGEVLGIIGRNGAGKSTLLKILSRITEPTTGFAELHGRVGSLLEVGTGFHLELSGRENVFLNGAILGMSRADIDRKFDEIVAFAEVERFIDTPVKHYSSGMYLRLAFAVAAHLEPEILLVDEVLAVGDADFQKKCLGKMKDISNQGRTVLFVSHNMQAVSTLTDRCILLSQGECEKSGPTAQVVEHYLYKAQTQDPTYHGAPSLVEPRIVGIEVKTSLSGNAQLVGHPMEFHFTINVPSPMRGTALSFQLVNSSDQPILHILTLDSEMPICRRTGEFTLVCHIPKVRLYPGRYTMTVHFAERPGRKKLQIAESVCPFEVVNHQLRDYYWAPAAATYVEESEWRIETNMGPPDRVAEQSPATREEIRAI